MKQLLLTLLAVLLATGTASARRLELGIRGGVNFTDYSFTPTRIDGVRFAPGPDRAGYEAGLLLRLNLTRHLHVQSELNFAGINYEVRAEHASRNRLMLRTERLELPVQIGFRIGILRLFGGVQFRLAESFRSNDPQLLRIRFNDNDIAIQGGAGLAIRRFFLEFRVAGYPRQHVRQHFFSGAEGRSVRVSRDIVYGISTGFLF